MKKGLIVSILSVIISLSNVNAQKVDYSVVSVPEESGIDFMQVTSYISGDIAEVSDTDFDYDDFEDYEDAMEDIEDFSAMAGDLKMFSAYIPVNFGYKYSFNESWSIFPHAGITLRGNISGKLKGKNFDVDGDSDDTELNVFDKKDMDKTWKRFQIGWQIGAGVNYNKFYLSASYGTDFSEITEKSKLKTTSITIGYNF